jgi:hypothetical protein
MYDTITELDELVSTYSELHKDVHGVKARWYRAASVEQAYADIDILQAQGEDIWAQAHLARKVEGVNVELRIVKLVEMGAGDRETAVRWLHEAEGTAGDNELLCFFLGLEYGYFK